MTKKKAKWRDKNPKLAAISDNLKEICEIPHDLVYDFGRHRHELTLTVPDSGKPYRQFVTITEHDIAINSYGGRGVPVSHKGNMEVILGVMLEAGIIKPFDGA